MGVGLVLGGVGGSVLAVAELQLGGSLLGRGLRAVSGSRVLLLRAVVAIGQTLVQLDEVRRDLLVVVGLPELQDGYLVPDGSLTRKNAYGDLLDIGRIFKDFKVNNVRTKNGAYKAVPSGDDQMLGAAFALWSDNIDRKASGLSESDLYWRFFDAMPFYAEKTWAATGQEKGTSAKLTALARCAALCTRRG